MGLDMYLYGEKMSMKFGEDKPQEDGFPLVSKTLELGYWRKHPNLHGYIVETFADGVDECQRIELSEDDMKKIIEAIENDKLPYTEGFFFGKSYKSGEPGYEREKQESIDTFKKAIEWVTKPGLEDEWRFVKYRASW